MKIEIQSGKTRITTEIIQSSNFSILEHKNSISVLDELGSGINSFDTCVIITIEGFKDVLYFINDHFHGIQDISILLLEDSQTLLIGGKSSSTAIDLVKGISKEQFEHFLFWSFTVSKDARFVIENGEIDCLLRNNKGDILGSTYVEPPYDFEIDNKGVTCTWEGMPGKSFLEFPSEA